MTGPARPRSVAALVVSGRLQEVQPDGEAALARLGRAEEKLGAAAQIVEIDVDIAYVTAYDAMRIAVTAHMLAAGLRVPANRPGAHEVVGSYAEAMVDTPSSAQFQRMRRRRNKAEYDDIVIGRADVEADLTHARAVVTAVRSALDEA